MQYKQFLRYAGYILLVVAALGIIALGPSPSSSIFGEYLYFDYNQTLIHFLLGVIALAASRFDYEPLHRYLTAAMGIVAVTVTAYSFYRTGAPQPNLFVSNIEVPVESLLYMAFGLWALWVVLMPPGPIFVKEDEQS